MVRGEATSRKLILPHAKEDTPKVIFVVVCALVEGSLKFALPMYVLPPNQPAYLEK